MAVLNSVSPQYIVIGSGPSGVSCASALLSRDLEVTMVDAGYRLDESLATIVNELRETPPVFWPKSHIERIKRPVIASLSGVTQKLFFGSTHVFGDPSGNFSVEYKNFGGDFSFAEGGLSNVWGAAMLPVADSEIRDWPVSRADLEKSYRAILNFVPLAAESDDLEKLFPLYVSKPGSLRRSTQGQQFLQHSKKKSIKQEKAGFLVGAARLAVHAQGGDASCRYCGLCIYGCPYGSIYSTVETLNKLKMNPRFTYLGGKIALKFFESPSHITLKILDSQTGLESEIEGTQLYLGMGTISTSRLVLESAGAINRPLKVFDNQMFLFPFFSFKKAKAASVEIGVTLTQVYLELSRQSLSDYLIHFQLYGMSDIILKALQKILPNFLLRSRLISQEILGRISIILGVLHSKDSAGAVIVLRQYPSGTRLEIEGLKGQPMPQRIRKVLFYFFRKSGLFGGVTIPGFAVKGRPGASNHLGGTLPMTRDPGPFQCDPNGRLHGYSRVKVIDASSLPSLPASTLTFTIMANAYRIGSIPSEA